MKDKPEETADTSEWPGADEWGKDPYAIDTSKQHQETGVAITTDEADPWGAPGNDPWTTSTSNATKNDDDDDDPWGIANADDPWAPAPAVAKS